MLRWCTLFIAVKIKYGHPNNIKQKSDIYENEYTNYYLKQIYTNYYLKTKPIQKLSLL